MAKTNGELMSIGQIARAMGLATTALRYYERQGVLIPTARSQAGYRMYDRRAVEQLGFIRAAQAVGFKLEDIRVLLDLEDGEERRCKVEVRELIQKRLAEVEQKMKDLRRVRGALSQALQECQSSGGDDCPVLLELHTAEKKVGPREVKHGVRRHAKK